MNEASLSYNSHSLLQFNGTPLLTCVPQSGEPSYIYSKKALERRWELFFQALRQSISQPISVHYAVKANAHPEMIQFFYKKGAGFDVVSGGELLKVVQAGVTAKDIIFSGVGKTIQEIDLALNKEIKQINVESAAELKRIVERAEALKKNIDVGLRINPSVDPQTHPYISTGFKENKFGIDESSISECLNLLKKSKGVRLRSLTCHIGSQLLDFNAHGESLRSMKRIFLEIQKMGFPMERLDIGGGLGIYYEKDEAADVLALKNYCEETQKELKDFPAHIMFEPGRFLVARAGLLLTEVQYIKETPFKKFIIVNSGMHHLMRPALYGAFHRIFPLIKRDGEEKKYDVVGPVCESSDFFAKERLLTPVEQGDWLAIADAGAYGYSMMSLYNAFAPPKELFI